MMHYEIKAAEPYDLDACMRVLQSAVAHMRSRGFLQWDDKYPNREVLQNDIRAGSLHVVRVAGAVAGFAAFDRNEPAEYAAIDFQYPTPAMYVHRLCIDPAFQRRGLALSLMQFAFGLASQKGCRSIRLDTRSDNSAALALYRKLGYRIRGHVHFPRCPGYEFPCMEIVISPAPGNTSSL